MGKIDDMRRMREAALADAEKRAAKRPAAPAPARTSPPAALTDEKETPARPTRSTAARKEVASKAGSVVGELGRCPACGKMKPLANGVMSSHQKGLGKACAGSRKRPA